MKKNLPGGRYRIVLSVLGLSLLAGVVLAFSGQVSSHSFLPLIQGESQQTVAADQQIAVKTDGENGTLEKLIVSSGSASLDLDLGRLNGGVSSRKVANLNFNVQPDAFFTVLALNGEFRGTLPSSMSLISQNTLTGLPTRLNASLNQLVIESLPWGGDFDLAVRDSQNGFTFFNVEGHEFNYDGNSRSLAIENGRLLLSKEFASELGRDAGLQVGTLSTSAVMRPIEITQIVNGDVTSERMPVVDVGETGTTPGPDVIVGDLSGLAQFGTSGTQVGLAVGTDSCNAGTVDLDWFADPSNDHPVIPQNLYRMSGGASNDQTFEEIGQSSVKHAFTALTNNICGFGCNGVG